jgi:hypothetical protein
MPRAFTTLAALAIWPVLVFGQSALTPEDVLERIAKNGARVTVAQIYSNPMQWRAVLTGIATGSKLWLNAAVGLRSGSDAGASNQIDLALGEALEHHPQWVLAVAVPAVGYKRVCGAPDVDDARYNSYSLSTAAIDRRKSMLRSVTGGEADSARECIRNLNDSVAGVARFYGVH